MPIQARSIKVLVKSLAFAAMSSAVMACSGGGGSNSNQAPSPVPAPGPPVSGSAKGTMPLTKNFWCREVTDPQDMNNELRFEFFDNGRVGMTLFALADGSRAESVQHKDGTYTINQSTLSINIDGQIRNQKFEVIPVSTTGSPELLLDQDVYDSCK